MFDGTDIPENKIEQCVACDGRGIITVISIVNDTERETLTQCPVCNGVGTV